MMGVSPASRIRSLNEITMSFFAATSSTCICCGSFGAAPRISKSSDTSLMS